MLIASRIQATRVNILARIRLVADVASQLWRRRRVHYGFLALTLSAGAVYTYSLWGTVTGGSETTFKPAPIESVSPKSATSVVTEDITTNSDSDASPSSSTVTNHTSVTINGKAIPVPADGNVNTVLSDGDTTTSVDVSHTSTTSGTSRSNSHLRIDVHSHSSTSEEVDSSD